VELTLSDQQIERYSRHIVLEDVGVNGQEKLLASKVLIIGAGGLGAPAALYLAAAGVGTLGLVDADQVDISNLQRQVIHHTDDIGRDKVTSAANKLRAINPDVTVKEFHLRAEASNILDLIKDYDFVVDGTDNFAAKFLINDACVFGQQTLLPCRHLAFRRPADDCAAGHQCVLQVCFQPASAASGCALLFAGGGVGRRGRRGGVFASDGSPEIAFGSGRPLDRHPARVERPAHGFSAR